MPIIYVAVLALLTVLSLRTLVILGTRAPWTSAGWLATIAYDCGASYELIARTHLAWHAPYVALAGLMVAFAIAGVRDEPQGDPWWWPIRLGATRGAKKR